MRPYPCISNEYSYINTTWCGRKINPSTEWTYVSLDRALNAALRPCADCCRAAMFAISMRIGPEDTERTTISSET